METLVDGGAEAVEVSLAVVDDPSRVITIDTSHETVQRIPGQLGIGSSIRGAG